MSKKSSLIGLLCTVVGVILSIVVYVVTSSKLAKDASDAQKLAQSLGQEVEVASVWTREEGMYLIPVVE